MLGVCNGSSNDALKLVAAIRMREGAALLKHCEKQIKVKEAEYEKTTERLAKEMLKSQARSSSGSRGALIGVKSVNRTKVQLEKIVQVKAYLEGVVKETKKIMIKGKEKPAEMVIPFDTEKIKKEIKKIEKEVEKSDSTTSTSTAESFLKEMEDFDRSIDVQ
jgi:hypothetical protein